MDTDPFGNVVVAGRATVLDDTPAFVVRHYAR